MITSDIKNHNAYLFNVDILIGDESNAKAFEKLLHLLNRSGVIDFRVQQGLELGKVIDRYVENEPEQNVILSRNKTKTNALHTLDNSLKQTKPTLNQSESSATSASSTPPIAVADRIYGYIADKRLIRLHVNKGLGIKLSIPCRIISFDDTKQMLTVYHVDEKQVYTFTINEIDDFIE